MYYTLYYKEAVMTSIRLPETLENKLSREARKKKTTKSEIIKTALVEYLSREEQMPSPFKLGETIFGKYGNGSTDDSATYKQRLKEKLHDKHAH